MMSGSTPDIGSSESPALFNLQNVNNEPSPMLKSGNMNIPGSAELPGQIHPNLTRGSNSPDSFVL